MITENEAAEILRAQGYAVGVPDASTGRVRVWIRSADEAVDVEISRELQELAEGKLSFEEIQERRDRETPARAA